MERYFHMNATELFAPTISVAEVVVRAFVLYVGLLVLLRVIPKRQVGRSSPTDLRFVILVGNFAADGIAKRAESLSDVLVVLAAVLLLAYALDWLAYRAPLVRWLIFEPPTCLVRDGRLLKTNLRLEMVTEDELMRELRRQGVSDLAEVKSAQLEADGEISVLKCPEREPGTAPPSGGADPAEAP